MLHHRVRRLLISAAAAALPSAAFAQVSDSWAVDVGTAGGSWSVASNWANSTVPNAGGTATFGTLPTFTSAPINIFQDLPTVTLAGISFQSQITYLLRAPAASPTNSITLTGPSRLDAPIPSINTLSTTTFGQQIQMPITGASGLVKSGPGTVTLWQNTNTYTGGTRVEDGVLVLRQIGDAGLGDTAGSVTLDGGTIRVTTTAWNAPVTRQIHFAAGGGTIEATTTGTTTFNGGVFGAGDLNKTGSRGLILTAPSPISGAVNVLAGSLAVNGNGALPGAAAINVRDSLVIDNTAINLIDRISNTAPLTLHGASLSYTGNSSAGSSEQLADTLFSRGTTTVTLTPGAGQTANIGLGFVGRDLGAAVFFRGTSLGGPPGPGVTNVIMAAPPTLVGGGGAAGSTNISIVPWMFGNTNATAALNAATNSFVTYDAGGIRPLDLAGEYVTGILGAAPTDNVRFTGASALGGAQTINSLILAGSGPLVGAGTLTITSGALLNTTNGYAMDVNLNFGPAEAMILAPASISFNGVISGSGGLTKQGAGVATFGNANTYTGTTIIGGGTAAFVTDVPSGGPSAFGNSASAVVLAPAGVGTGGTTARLVYASAGNASFDRPLDVTGRIALNNQATIPGFGLNTANTLRMTGTITLDNSPLTFVGVSGSLLSIDGKITGAGGPVTDNGTGSGTIRLNNNNDFTGGAELSGATWQIGSDKAFGNGGLLKMVQVSGQPTLMAVGGPRVVTNPTVAFSFSSNYWNIAGSEDLTFAGSINLSGSYTHNINNAALTTYAGVLHTGGFTKAGTGVLVLSGDNIYTGTTTLSSGVLRVAHPNALGGVAAPTVVAGGAALEIGGGILSGEPVTINGTGGASTGAIRSTGGDNRFGHVTVASAAAIGVDAGTLRIGNIAAATGTQGLFKPGPGTLEARRYRLAALDVLDGVAAVASGRTTDKTSVVNTLVVATGARLDLGDNDLVVDYPASTPYPLIRQLLIDGYAGGAWNGTGIASSVAAATPGSRTALGYAEATDLFTTFPATFSGQMVDNSSVLVRYTLTGDATLDGTVGISDFSILGAGYNQSGDWVDGDFNFDGMIGIGDFSLLASNYNQSLPTTTARPSAVPEPATMGIVGLTGLLARRRRLA